MHGSLKNKVVFLLGLMVIALFGREVAAQEKWQSVGTLSSLKHGMSFATELYSEKYGIAVAAPYLWGAGVSLNSKLEWLDSNDTPRFDEYELSRWDGNKWTLFKSEDILSGKYGGELVGGAVFEENGNLYIQRWDSIGTNSHGGILKFEADTFRPVLEARPDLGIHFYSNFAYSGDTLFALAFKDSSAYDSTFGCNNNYPGVIHLLWTTSDTSGIIHINAWYDPNRYFNLWIINNRPCINQWGAIKHVGCCHSACWPNLACWDGNKWRKLVDNDVGNSAVSMTRWRGNIVVGGGWDIEMLVINQWVKISPEELKDTRKLLVHKDKLYALFFEKGVWVYDGVQWARVGTQTFSGSTHPAWSSPRFFNMAIYKDELYLYGTFIKIDTDTIPQLARIKLLNDSNRPPTAQNDVASVSNRGPYEIVVKQNDSDPDGDYLVTEILAGPRHGIADILASDEISYTPDLFYDGPDSIHYRVCDKGGLCDQAWLNIMVGFVNDPPQARNDTLVTTFHDTIIIRVQANDSEPNGDLMNSKVINAPNLGDAIVAANRRDIIYFPPKEIVQLKDSFQYQVCDTFGACDTAWVYITLDSTVVVHSVQAPTTDLRAYPNPATQKVTIYYRLDNPSTVRIILCDLVGKEIKAILDEFQQVGEHRLETDLSSLPTGFYVLSFVSGAQRQYVRFSKE